MSHYCNKHSPSPIRNNTDNGLKQSTGQKDFAKDNNQTQYPSPFNKSGLKNFYTPNNLRGQKTESTHEGISPLFQNKFQQFQTSSNTPFQNYVSNQGIPLQPYQIDQMKLRQEIAAREHEIKLLAQMDYLLDLIKDIDKNHNVHIDSQKIEEIKQLKSNYENINEDIQNLSMSQSLNEKKENKQRSLKEISSLPQEEQLNNSVKSQRLKNEDSLKESIVLSKDNEIRQSKPQTILEYQQRYASPIQKLEKSIQTSLQLIQSQQKIPTSPNNYIDKSLFEQQSNLYEKQLKDLFEENQCLKKNIADSQLYKKPLIQLQEPLQTIINPRSSIQTTPQSQINNQTENKAIQDLKEALKEKEADLQILIQNITLEKNYNISLAEENEQLKAKLQNSEKEVQELQESRPRFVSFQGQNQGQDAYSFAGDSNYNSNTIDEVIPQQPLQDNLNRIEKELEQKQSELHQKQEQYLQRLSEIDQEQKQRIKHFQEEINKLNNENQNLQEELNKKNVLYDEYAEKFNQDKLNSLILKYEEQLEAEQIKNFLSSGIQDQLGNTVAEQEQEIQNLQKQLEQNKLQQQKIQQEQIQQIQENNQKLNDLAIQNATLSQDIDSLKAQDEEQKYQINYLNQEIQQLKQKYIDIEMKKENLILENNELKEQIDILEKARNNEACMKEDSIKQVSNLQALLDQKNNEILSLAQQKDTMQAEYNELLQNLNEMDSNLKNLQEEFQQSKNQQEMIRRETFELKQAIDQSGPAEDEEDEEIRQSINDLKKELNIKDEKDKRSSQDRNFDFNDEEDKIELHQSNSSKHSNSDQSVHKSARLQQQNNDNNQKTQGQNFIDQNSKRGSQYTQNQDQNNQINNQDPENDCKDCDMCIIEEVSRQNESLKKQLLIKEMEIIELKTNPSYSAKVQDQINSFDKLPFSSGKGNKYLEINEQMGNIRLFDSPAVRNQQAQQAMTSPLGLANQIIKQSRPQNSNSKQPEQYSSTSKNQYPSNQAQQENFSIIQSEIDHLQKMFDQKCKEVDSWKKTYKSQFNDN